MKKSLSILLVIVFLLPLVCIAEAEPFSNNPDMIEKAALSVLKLSTFDIFGDPVATGSGFVMFDNRTLITNYHVMEDAYTMTAESDEGYQYYITGIKTADKKKDIAIMQFSAPTVMTPLTYSLDGIKRGERVTAIGSPVGLKNSVSMGNISYVFKEADVNWIQTTAPISHGSSGGALFNEEGEVIGVTSATRSDGQNINFAINIIEAVDLYQKWDHTVIKLGQQPGFPDMLCDQGDKYYWSDTNEENYDLAAKYYEKAAELGQIHAVYMLGRCYFNGNGVKKNEKKAIEFLSRASYLGNSDAMELLGDGYLNGNVLEKDESKGLELLYQAAKFENTKAMNDLAIYYNNRKEYDKKIKWAQESANYGDGDGMYILGHSFDYGLGVEADKRKAFEWYLKAAEAGSGDGMCQIGYFFQDGVGTDASTEKMIYWFEKSAETNNERGLVALADCYYRGIGVKQNKKRAFDLVLKATDLDYSLAMILVGLVFENGDVNYNLAEEWYQKAIDAGDEDAQQYLKNLHSGIRNTW